MSGPATPVPIVTIGVPVFNGERFLGQCLDSLLAQSFADFTLLIADNASLDGTEEVGRRYAALDPRVRYVRHDSNRGMYGNFEFLLRSARTRYFKLANADDFWDKDMLAEALAVMQREPTVELCYPMMTLVAQDGSVSGRYDRRLHVMEDDPVARFQRVLSEIGLVSQMMGVVRTSTVQRFVPLLNHPVADRMWIAELALYGRIFQTDEYRYFRRFHPGSSSHDRGSAEHLVTHVLEAGTTRVSFMAWKYHLGLLRRVLHAPLSVQNKFRAAGPLLRSMMWDRGLLARELWSASSKW